VLQTPGVLERVQGHMQCSCRHIEDGNGPPGESDLLPVLDERRPDRGRVDTGARDREVQVHGHLAFGRPVSAVADRIAWDRARRRWFYAAVGRTVDR
jgi:hypothetical protein